MNNGNTSTHGKRFTKYEDDILIKLHWHYGRNWLQYAQQYLPDRSEQSLCSRMVILRRRHHWQK